MIPKHVNRHAVGATLVLAAALVACGDATDPTTPSSAEESAAVAPSTAEPTTDTTPDDHADTLDHAFKQIVASIDARGSEGAAAAVAASRPAMLLFAASW